MIDVALVTRKLALILQDLPALPLSLDAVRQFVEKQPTDCKGLLSDYIEIASRSGDRTHSPEP